MQVVVAFDPGGTTGMTVARKKDPGRRVSGEWTWEFYELGPSQHHAILWRDLNHLNVLIPKSVDLTVVCESFDHRANEAAELISCEYIGIIVLWCTVKEVRLVMQTPSEAKNFWTDNKLKHLGLYHPTKGDHSNDATRHALRFITQWRDKTFIYQLKGINGASAV